MIAADRVESGFVDTIPVEIADDNPLAIPFDLKDSVGGVEPAVAVAVDDDLIPSDYGDFVDIPREQVVNTLETARRFVAAMQVAIDAAGRK